MTVRMKQDTVIEFIAAAIDAPVDMMVMPSTFSGDEFATDKTDTAFPNPKMLEPRPVPEISMDLAILTFLIVELVLWVKRIGIAAYLYVTLDRQPSSREEPIRSPFVLVIDREGMEATIRKCRIAEILPIDPMNWIS